MLLIETLSEVTEAGGTIETTLPPECIAADGDGSITPFLFVELMAQSYAAVKGWEIHHAGKTFPIGYLVGVQKFEISGTLKSEQPITIRVETVGEFEGFAVVEGTVSSEDAPLAQGKIKLWVPEEV